MATGPSGNVVQGGLQLRLQRYQLLCNQSGGVAVTVLRDNFCYNKRLGRKLRLDTIGRKPSQESDLREAELETDLPRTETALVFLRKHQRRTSEVKDRIGERPSGSSPITDWPPLEKTRTLRCEMWTPTPDDMKQDLREMRNGDHPGN